MVEMKKALIPIPQITQRILLLRGERVLLDFDLAALYDVETRVLNQAVKRNAQRFPSDFMFRLSEQEMEMVSQFVTPSAQRPQKKETSNSSQSVMSSRKHRGKRYRPYAFTEQGVAMLSSVLKSERAVKVKIAIMRAFVKLRETIETDRELARKFAQLEKHVGKHDIEIAVIIDAIRQLMVPPEKPSREIGFHVREKAPRYLTANHR